MRAKEPESKLIKPPQELARGLISFKATIVTVWLDEQLVGPDWARKHH